MQAVNDPLVVVEADTTAIPAPSTGRVVLVDVVRGLAIALVALGHTNQGELSRGWWAGSAVGAHLNRFIYSCHMPAFFFLSGIFVSPSLRKLGLLGFTAQKARTLLYPFFLWSLLIPLATFPLAYLGLMRPQPLKAILLNLVTGNSAWFLPALFVSLVLAGACFRVPPVVLFLASYVLASTWHPVAALALDRAVAYLPFVVAGMWLGPAPLARIKLAPPWSLVCAGLLGATLYLAVQRLTAPWQVRFGLLPAGFVGSAMLVLVGQAMLRWRLGRAMALAGRASLWIFLLAPFPQGLIRALLLAAHCTQPLVQLLAPTLAAILVPVWLHQRRHTLHLDALFSFPRP